MNYTKKLAAVILVFAVVLGFTGCAAKMTREAFISEIKAMGAEETDKLDVVLLSISRMGVDSLYYVAADEEDARDFGNLALNRFNNMSDIKADDFIAATIAEKGSDGKYYSTAILYYSFESDSKAEKTYKNICDAYINDKYAKTGKNSSCSYSVEADVSAAGSNNIATGVYLQGNTVVFLMSKSAVGDGYKTADKFCKKFGFVSPSKV